MYTEFNHDIYQNYLTNCDKLEKEVARSISYFSDHGYDNAVIMTTLISTTVRIARQSTNDIESSTAIILLDKALNILRGQK